MRFCFRQQRRYNRVIVVSLMLRIINVYIIITAIALQSTTTQQIYYYNTYKIVVPESM